VDQTRANDADVIIIGGSLAGLQAALTLGRACRRVVVFDDANPRNAPAAHVHNFLGQHSPTPAALLDDARAALRDYDVIITPERVTKIEPVPERRTFKVISREGRVGLARAVVLATGLIDELPDVPGVSELWGRDVVACPHCHGWEVRGQPLAQLGMRGLAQRGVDRALLLSRWSEYVTLLTDGDQLESDQYARLAAAGVTVQTQPVRRLVHHDKRLEGVELADGIRLTPRAVFTVTRQRQQSDLADQLGCRHAEQGTSAAVETDGTGRTSVPGVWAAGTTTVPALLAIGAAGHASIVAVSIHNDLLEQDIAAHL
jgi:thioredoxin reductase